MLRKELEIRNKQIEDLNARLAEVSSALVMAQQMAQAAQTLHAGTIQQQFIEGAADPAPEQSQKSEKRSWLSRLFGKQD